MKTHEAASRVGAPAPRAVVMRRVAGGRVAGGGPATARESVTRPAEGDTRHAIVSLLMERGACTAVDIGAALDITPTAVRRHLDILVDAGEVTTATPSGHSARGRGRPAREFLLTQTGRRQLAQGYDALAQDALRALREVGGEDAVRAFARRRAEAAVAAAKDDASRDTGEAARRIALALSDAGFAADTRTVGTGVQICQHHCPVSEVATEFPELCEAEIEVIGELLGTHVQRLATIANGDRACTTHVPLITGQPKERG
ncbi:helix-turn-helix transcriptional regulator [Tsukamurella soli]|uniref:Transcriptional regulator n=1 Tax=Tsukamurella soli TaxID=644556 RepID=A0ABP8J0G0_9ACTN